MLTNRMAQWVACNVYISASGKPHHVPLLLSLLEQAQAAACRNVSPTVVVVHAYADPVYNRSSIHLVGTAKRIATDAANLACRAFEQLRDVASDYEDIRSKAYHPSVGLVDHIAVMPLTNNNDADSSYAIELLEKNQDDTPSGWAAKQIGQAMMDHMEEVQIYYYGTAHPYKIPLAQVRREQTSFLQSNILATKDIHRDITTVGAPPHFVENFNIRLRCSAQTARSLTRRIRERDGGLPGVEALTLPYSNDRWEVAANLLRPDQASAEDVQALVSQWEAEQTQQLVETCYRVGTTEDQCLRALHSSKEGRQLHDQEVSNRFCNYLSSVP